MVNQKSITSIKSQVETALHNLSQDTLLDLFYQHLHYDRESQLISTRQWDKKIEQSIEDRSPTVIASAGNGVFQIIYIRLKSDSLNNKQEQRKIIEKLLPDRPYSLFVFTNCHQSQWQFVNVKHQTSAQCQRLFRRICIAKGEVNRTAIEQISEIDLKLLGKDLAIISPLEIQQHHDRAFDVEAVTDKFFAEYRRVFESVESQISGIPNKDTQRLFTQKLFNRLMFIAFIQKKGWLKFGKSTDYLNALWQDYKSAIHAESNFYGDRLSHLFFAGLNDPHQQEALTGIIGTVPYLNGGLFQQGEDEKNALISLPDSAIELIFTELLDRFNFTVTESTPLDEEVAVDPEMLGKVFEELVTGRHDSGSYYTPKSIVSFMCREAIKGYLNGNTESSKVSIAKFVDDRDAAQLSDPELIFKALKKVTVCDTACGSGAYLLGMLHELLELRECLFTSKNIGSQTIYDRKLEIIENNLYGVDKELFAISIARLRLWLSLAVDFEGEIPNPLPNLNYKLEVGDSLLAPVTTGMGLIRDEWIGQYRNLKARYVTTHHSNDKQQLEREIATIKSNIALLTHGGNDRVQGFDWVVEFAEVLADGGFDIQVANPPYVRHEKIQEFKPQLKQLYPEIYHGTSDLYCYFYARSLQLLKPGGMLAFISSNKWFRAGYGEKLRQHIAETCQIHSITDFGDLPVFKSASVLTTICICSARQKRDVATVFTQVKSLKYPYSNLHEVIRENGIILPTQAISGTNWLLTDDINAARLQQMESKGIPLGNYIQGKIYRGVLTGFNQAFVIDAGTRDKLIFEDPASEEIIKPLVIGDDVRKWHLNDKARYLIFTRRGIEIDRYPAIHKHLQQWQTRLEPKPQNWDTSEKWTGRKAGAYKWYEIQDEVAYCAEFERPKIVYPVMAQSNRFTLDKSGAFINDKAFIIPTDELYLLGVLNSTHIWNYLHSTCSALQGQTIELRTTYTNKVPIPPASKTAQKAISQLVQKCLDAEGIDCEQWEKEIDLRVAKLYGF